ncbi:MAG: SRPBCC family protein [Planctomycetota bacterium]
MSREVRVLVAAIAGVILLFFGLGSALADRWQVVTAQTMPAPPERVLPLVRDFQAWRDWSALSMTERADTKVSIEGEPGTVGHSLVWRSGREEAALRLTRVDTSGIEWEFLSKLAGEDLRVRGKGSLRVVGEGQGSRVTWTDESEVDGLLGRWFAWFGAQQDSQRRFQDASLSGLRSKLEGR